jgi:hypothetical protein
LGISKLKNLNKLKRIKPLFHTDKEGNFAGFFLHEQTGTFCGKERQQICLNFCDRSLWFVFRGTRQSLLAFFMSKPNSVAVSGGN